ncbi:TetR/AcrR family transcriptional regulator [Variovorax sp. J22P168]|uniref:TetR/AcrR family transcriptional regulator n=1 Tax=Variovorax jilinensis TaxID=3053513 RepID=UPI002578CE9C|nr:TetR/AcrR family transcriptional regulator [Variovorax sp. J22P168]MDM0011366.1 TetR/AcrR family transcriptional regulator [Variovorax sp. J22P168]
MASTSRTAPSPAPAPASIPPAVARRDAAATRAALIEAAVGEFSSNGFAGARVDEIARAAGVNKQLVYHYFESKQGLYLVALESVYAEIREKEQRLSLGELEPVEAMTQLIAFSFDYLAEHPEFIALLTDENRNQGSHILDSERLQKMHSPFIEMLEATLERGVAQGVFRPDYDAINLYISIAGISYFFFSNNHTLSAIFGKQLGSRGALVQRRRHVIEFALNALRP